MNQGSKMSNPTAVLPDVDDDDFKDDEQVGTFGMERQASMLKKGGSGGNKKQKKGQNSRQRKSK